MIQFHKNMVKTLRGFSVATKLILIFKLNLLADKLDHRVNLKLYFTHCNVRNVK